MLPIANLTFEPIKLNTTDVSSFFVPVTDAADNSVDDGTTAATEV